MLVSIVIPCYKEARNIALLVPLIRRELSARSIHHEIIIVDDNSQDGIEQVVQELNLQESNVKLFIRVNERGLSTAVIYGMNKSKGDILICMDGDLSHNPKYLPSIIDEYKEPEVDFVLGSRFVNGGQIEKGWGIYRYLNSKIATLLSKPLVPQVTDPMSGFFAITKEKFSCASHLVPLGYKIGLELMIKCSCKKIKEVPIFFEDRKYGDSKLSFKEQLNYLVHLSHLYDFKFPKLSTSLKFLMTFLLGVIISLSSVKFLNVGLKDWPIWYSPILLSHGILYFSYLHLSKGIVKISKPFQSFIAICLLELLGIIIVHSFIELPQDFLFFSVLATGVLGRFLGRKLFKHDLKPGMLYKNDLLKFDEKLTCQVCRDKDFFLPYGIYNKWLVECSGCSLQFAYPQPEDSELEEIYSKHYFEEWGTKTNFDSIGKIKALTFQKILDRVNQDIKVKRCLDFGCGLGFVIEQGIKCHFEMYGVEPIKEIVQNLSQKFNGEAVITDRLETVEGKFDLITMYDVIEHLREPGAVLSSFKEVLSSNGRVSITTIDKSSFWSRMMKHKWFHIHRAHLWYFDKKSLKRLCENAGFDVVYVRSAEKYFTLRYILGILEVKSGYFVFRKLSKLLLKLTPNKWLDWVLPAIKEGQECLLKVK